MSMADASTACSARNVYGFGCLDCKHDGRRHDARYQKHRWPPLYLRFPDDPSEGRSNDRRGAEWHAACSASRVPRTSAADTMQSGYGAIVAHWAFPP